MSNTFLQRIKNLLSSNDKEAKTPEEQAKQTVKTERDLKEQQAFIESLNYFTQPGHNIPEDVITVEDAPINSLTDFMREQHSSTGIQLSASLANTPHVLDGTASQGYLAGQLLVATPVIDTGCFQRAVVYVFAHNKEGAMGVIINQPLETVDIGSLVENAPAKEEMHEDIDVYFGGPVDKHRGFVLHSADYASDQILTRHNGIALTASASILDDIIAGNGPEKAYLTVGLAGWSAGQLEQEIEQNSWITVPATSDLVFNTEDDLKWAKASKSLGIDMQFYSTAVGHA